AEIDDHLAADAHDDRRPDLVLEVRGQRVAHRCEARIAHAVQKVRSATAHLVPSVRWARAGPTSSTTAARVTLPVMPRPQVRSIGAPGFEPGTSPTRTVRATRLRHAPTRLPVFHTLAPLWSRSARPPHGHPPGARQAPRADALSGLRSQRPPGPGAGRGQHGGRRRLRARGALRAGGRRARRAADRPPRALLG